MANINDLKRQHKEIHEIIDFIKSNLTEAKVKEKAPQLAQNISILAGKLKIHLISEDDVLYPKLINGDDIKAKNTAERFNTEMGGLAQSFTEYKQKYNVGSKILNNIDAYIKDTKEVFDALENRINREDKELYILL
jgi:iron-sulfur cluster repair protein YtfE (RIC family)